MTETTVAPSPQAPTEHTKRAVTLATLWRQFLPLSLSDVAMAMGDPMVNATVARLPDARLNLAAIGIAKSQAVFFESPIIMLLHASNALAGSKASRRTLWRFTLIAASCLTALLLLLCLPNVSSIVGRGPLGLDAALVGRVRSVLLILAPWPAAIAWRRYFQGILIRHGHGNDVGRAAIFRIGVVAAFLATGYLLNAPGTVVAGYGLIAGVFGEALYVTVAARMRSPFPEMDSARVLPTNLRAVWQFYWPLANSMLVVWGGRAAVLGVVARAKDGALALAAWPAALGLVLVVANSTRMVQQVIIRNRGKATDESLLTFAASVGAVCSTALLVLAAAPAGKAVVGAFVAGDRPLREAVSAVIAACAAVPLLVALQNALQGLLVADGNTRLVNRSTWVGTAVLLAGAGWGVKAGLPGATAASLALSASLTLEVALLGRGYQRKKWGNKGPYHEGTFGGV